MDIIWAAMKGPILERPEKGLLDRILNKVKVLRSKPRD